MQTVMQQYFDFFLALVLILGCLALLFAGIDSEVKSILCLSGGWIFGRAYQLKRRPV